MKKKALVIGAPGFIGRFICKEFARAGYAVVGVGLESPENASLERLEHYYSLVLPTDGKELAKIVEEHKPVVCIHSAGSASVPLSMKDPREDFRAGVDVTFELLDSLRTHSPLTRFVFLSSAAVYGNPTQRPISETSLLHPISPYGYHKRISEELCQEFTQVFSVPTTIVRIFSAYGPGLRRQVVWDLAGKMLRGERVVLQGTGNESRDFIHVKDISRAVLCLSEKAKFQAETYNLASGQETRISELAELLLELIKPVSPLEYDGIVPDGVPQNWCADISRLEKLGFSPSIELKDGLRQFVSWFRSGY